MRKRDKTCAKATPEEPKREQVALAAGDYSHVYP